MEPNSLNTQTCFPLTLSAKAEEDLKYAVFLFVWGSIAGWCLELVFRSVSTGTLTIPGAFYGPYCPIYGFGVVIIRFLCSDRRPIVAIGKIAVFTSALEYGISLIAEKGFHLVLWDYSNLPLNIAGRVSLSFSLAWAGLGYGFLRFLEPELRDIFDVYKKPALKYSLVGTAAIGTDALMSVLLR